MLCGRVLLFLAKLLPLTERSGVNLGGGFNTDNTTPVEDVQEVGAAALCIQSVFTATDLAAQTRLPVA